ncbi:nucleotide sugar dehydrogenase family protein [Synechococcus sp. MIT S9220]|uniref:UDP-N-acetyl-D-mannosamine dehydrogenase n=1 Tax=unclassified Synechococcus TaxID=2626047 RepID=UPI00164C1F29|nr:UDP-N-acetyl-D-mannosamine dehydrogenase [Synechococcus sp. MIT S9220]NOL48009.1 UDP-N-acetyl-D-mannosamine dehydrogenase [Synechococcus sp. MIT S9220]QNJ21553.1 nucleotide sugar dehydrogenase family protein [Synechococcus sp. MIT S9220]
MSTCCILGLGYIGLPTAVVLARAGHRVIGVDVNSEVVAKVNQGIIHIVEPDLDEAVASVVASGTLFAQVVPAPADVFIIAVPTPFRISTQHIPQPNIDYVLEAARSISPYLRPGNLVLLESTSPVGTTEQMANEISRYCGFNHDQIDIAYCPERVLPGRILRELISNDRVIGGLTSSAADAGHKFYTSFCKGKILKTTARTAELVKLSENAFRDVNIAFANELSIVCEDFGVNVLDLIELANHHPRVNILRPGCGVGGHCIAVDPWFIASAAPDCTHLIQAARHVNDAKSRWVIEQVQLRAGALQLQLGRPVRIGCLGLSFKPDVDDLRQSPALHITTELLLAGLDVIACEPNLLEHPTINLHSLQTVLAEADLLVFLVAHSPFKGLPLEGKSVFDLCGVTQPSGL